MAAVAQVESSPRGSGGGGGDENPADDGGVAVGGPLALGQPKQTSAIFMWLGMETDFKVDPVECNGVNIGRLDFKYRTWKDTGTVPDQCGAALEGGFTGNGADPCLLGQQPGTEYFWIQTVLTNAPAPGRGPGEYVDAPKPRDNPQYPGTSNNNNPDNNPFTGRSYYDGPRRPEPAAGATNWIAENCLCCRVGNKINVIGSFLWGFNVNADGMTNNAMVDVQPVERGSWGPPTASALDTIARESQGTKTEAGWTVSEGCCCNKLFIPFCFSSISGGSFVTAAADTPNMVLDTVVVFPRNHPVVNFFQPPAHNWIAHPWPNGNIAPQLPYQSQGTQMFHQGIQFVNMQPQPGPITYQLQLQVAAHESFFDIFLHDAASNTWFPWASQTQELLGDLNGNGDVEEFDLPAWDLAFSNPPAYQQQYPGQNPIFRGDLTHNGALEPADRTLLEGVIFDELFADANGEAEILPCLGDIAPSGGNGHVNIDDLFTVIAAWGPCPVPANCPADIDGDGDVDIDDLFLVIAAWGPCS